MKCRGSWAWLGSIYILLPLEREIKVVGVVHFRVCVCVREREQENLIEGASQKKRKNCGRIRHPWLAVGTIDNVPVILAFFSSIGSSEWQSSSVLDVVYSCILLSSHFNLSHCTVSCRVVSTCPDDPEMWPANFSSSSPPTSPPIFFCPGSSLTSVCRKEMTDWLGFIAETNVSPDVFQFS